MGKGTNTNTQTDRAWKQLASFWAHHVERGVASSTLIAQRSRISKDEAKALRKLIKYGSVPTISAPKKFRIPKERKRTKTEPYVPASRAGEPRDPQNSVTQIFQAEPSAAPHPSNRSDASEVSLGNESILRPKGKRATTLHPPSRQVTNMRTLDFFDFSDDWTIITLPSAESPLGYLVARQCDLELTGIWIATLPACGVHGTRLVRPMPTQVGQGSSTVEVLKQARTWFERQAALEEAGKWVEPTEV